MKFVLLLSVNLMYLVVWPVSASAQEIEVQLTERTTEDSGGLGLEPLREMPRESLTLPSVDTTKARFMEEFYTHDTEDDKVISIMVIPQEEGELLYIDLNNDEDLTNDGPPHLFPTGDNEFVFYIQAHPDSLRKTGRLLKRIPALNFSNPTALSRFREDIIDEDGNLQPKALRTWRRYHPELDGRKGTFYYDAYIDLSRGKALLNESEYMIGLQDSNQNGLFNDEADRLYIDLNQNGKLQFKETTEIFKLDDVIKLAEASYKVTYVDPYGRSLRLQKTDETSTTYYLEEPSAEEHTEEPPEGTSGSIHASFWDLTFETIDGETISMKDVRGKYVLLNFWGEWCAPCYNEMPILVTAQKDIGHDKLQVISLLLTYDLEVARDVIAKHHLSWPQVRLDDEMEMRFKIHGYPTNLLIYPDGKRYLKAGEIDESFFDKNVQ